MVEGGRGGDRRKMMRGLSCPAKPALVLVGLLGKVRDGLVGGVVGSRTCCQRRRVCLGWPSSSLGPWLGGLNWKQMGIYLHFFPAVYSPERYEAAWSLRVT